MFCPYVMSADSLFTTGPNDPAARRLKTGMLNAVMPVVERMELSGFRISEAARKEFKDLAGEP